MPRKSIKQEKSIFQLSREAAGLTRAEAEEMTYISEDTIERIENGRNQRIASEDVLAMAKAYHDPLLPNRYCTSCCPIGKEYIAPVEPKDLRQMTIELLHGTNCLQSLSARLVEISVDDKISPEEQPDFSEICSVLDELASTIASLKLWASGAEQNRNTEKK